MTNHELEFMTIACEASDAQANGSLFIGEIDPILEATSRKGLTEKQVWKCQYSLMRAGYLQLSPNFNEVDIDPEWSHAAPAFTITRLGLRWWLRRKYGADYPKLVSDVKRTKADCLKKGITAVAEWAEKLNLPLLLVQKIMHAENL